VAGLFNINCESGDTLRLRIDCSANGSPADFTGCTAEFVLPSVTFTGSTAPGSVTIDPDTPGALHLYMSPADTSRLPDNASFRLRVTFPSGDVVTVLRGRVLVDV
jgi:hypothetical protein